MIYHITIYGYNNQQYVLNAIILEQQQNIIQDIESIPPTIKTTKPSYDNNTNNNDSSLSSSSTTPITSHVSTMPVPIDVGGDGSGGRHHHYYRHRNNQQFLSSLPSASPLSSLLVFNIVIQRYTNRTR